MENQRLQLIPSLNSDIGATPALAFTYIPEHVRVLLATLLNKMQRKLDSFLLLILVRAHHTKRITFANIFLFSVFIPKAFYLS